MTPSPAAPSPGQQPTPPPSNQVAPGQQKQKPSMPSWFSSMTSTTQQGKNNQPMTPSPSQEGLNHFKNIENSNGTYNVFIETHREQSEIEMVDF